MTKLDPSQKTQTAPDIRLHVCQAQRFVNQQDGQREVEGAGLTLYRKDCPFDTEIECFGIDDVTVGIDVEPIAVGLEQTLMANVEQVVAVTELEERPVGGVIGSAGDIDVEVSTFTMTIEVQAG